MTQARRRPDLGPMKVDRKDIDRLFVTVPTQKPRLNRLVFVPLLGFFVLILALFNAANSPYLDGYAVELLGLTAFLFMGGLLGSVPLFAAAYWAQNRHLHIRLSSRGLSVHHFQTWTASWTDIDRAEMAWSPRANTAIFRVYAEEKSVSWLVTVGDGRTQPALRHYESLVQQIVERAAHRENTPNAVPDALRTMATSEPG